MAQNGISTLKTNGIADKQKRQLAKLNLATANKVADGDRRSVYDINTLPTQWKFTDNTNVLINNPTPADDIISRPWLTPTFSGGFAPLEFNFTRELYRINNSASSFADAMVHTRDSIATFVDSDGILQTAGINVVRTGHHFYLDNVLTKGALFEPDGATNLLLNSATLSTQNVTVAAAKNTIHFTGTGTITLTGVSTAGPLVGAGTGEENRVSLTFTPTAGTLTLTVSGTVSNAQLELGAHPTSYIPTSGSEAVRGGDVLTVPHPSLPWGDTVSIQIEGYKTYADTDNGKELEYVSWVKDSQNSISVYLSTNGGRSGQIVIYQEADSETDRVFADSDAYAPGINVPFSIATRHGSTFVNGAFDGTALTEDTTPIALPDLETSDLKLCSKGGPFILTKFRMWDTDIGDTGIAEASTLPTLPTLPTFNPLSLFTGGADGIWHDPSDLSTLFQDSKGTTPVTASGQPVGLMLDKSQGLVLGPDVVNGSFTTDTDWVKENFTISGGAANNNTNGNIVQDYGETISVGDWFLVSVNVVSRTGGFIYPFIAGGFQDGAQRTRSLGVSSWYVRVTTLTNQTVGVITGNGPAGISIGDLSIQKVPGNHATQATAAARPTYQTSPDRATLDKVDDRLLATVPTGGFTGTMVLATDQGTASYGVTIPAGAYDIGARGGQYFPGNTIVGQVIRDGALSDREAAATEAYFVANGANASYGAVTSFRSFWRNWSEITSFPLIDTSAGTSFFQAWLGCSSLTSFPLIDTSEGTSFFQAWYNCSSLTSFPLIDTSAGTSFFMAWYNCNSLTSFPLIDTSAGTSFFMAWRDCSSLTSFPLIDTSAGTDFRYTWSNCNSLTSFPANAFDDISGGNFTSAFTSTALTQTSIDNILVSLVASGIAAGTRVFGQSGGSAPSSTGEAAIDTLRSRGWTVTVTGGY